ncbi:hypothetical protein [Bdellovibrio sp. HCB209]|uniref:hypothetical protein n=1 Tax=Bdellovibrio sp. HCB209 TaxID=3394354 RepID=UPI0039B54C2F
MKKQILSSLILAGSLVTAVSAFAAEENQSANTSTVKVTDVQKKDEQVGDIDNEITNARLRATLGSKSRWSFKSSLGYNGGSIEKPMDSLRPAYRYGARQTLTALSGDVGINYRVTERDSLSLSTGITIMDPFHGDITKPAKDPRYADQVAPRYQVSTPSMTWSRGYKAWGMQMASDATVAMYTDSDSSDTNSKGAIMASQTFLADLGNSNWSGGLNASFDYEVYGGGIKNAEVEADYASGLARRTDMILAIYPFAEYTFNDTYSFRTVFGYFEFYKDKDEYGNSTDFYQKEPYQSMGIGISVTRDIYLYPNIQFAPKDIRADRTNVALSANINLF